MDIVESLYGKYLVIIFLVLAFAINLGRVYLVETSQRTPGFWFTMLARFPICSVLPVLPIAYPTVMVMIKMNI